ncbi:MAG: zf-HC2 domain-containing protein [Acidobacteriaceae bacterium]|nr:zf-HC2 domain-containing protein [Acidobacteriaceae bacterium]
MTCWNVKRRTIDFVEGRLRKRDYSRVEAHLRECDACAVLVFQTRSMRCSLVDLPHPVPPTSLRSKLRVLASRERQLMMETDGSRLKRVWNAWKFRVNQLMRPLTIPATGGVISSVLLFGALAFTIGTTTRQVAYEVPVIYADRTDANLVPLELRSSVVLTLSLDGRGRITDYIVRDGSGGFVGDAARLQYNSISLPEFPSVLALAQPTIGDIRISFTPIVFRR